MRRWPHSPDTAPRRAPTTATRTLVTAAAARRATASEDAHGARIRAPSVGSLTPTTSVQFTESELTSPDSKLNKLEGHVITESYSSSWEALVRRQGSL